MPPKVSRLDQAITNELPSEATSAMGSNEKSNCTGVLHVAPASVERE